MVEFMKCRYPAFSEFLKIHGLLGIGYAYSKHKYAALKKVGQRVH